jgi:hypothetical protein
MAMAERQEPKDGGLEARRVRVGRRRLLAQGAALGAAGSLLPAGLPAGCSAPKTEAGPLADQNLIRASALSGEPLSAERVRAMKPMLEFTLKHLEVLREFDPDEEEPTTIFRFGKD